MKYFLLILLFVFYSSLKAEEQDSILTGQTKDKHIAYVNIINPLLFGKAGVAFTFRNIRADYFIYANYVYSPGILSTTLYFSNGQYGSPEGNSSGYSTSVFDIGFQYRFRSPLFGMPYAKYLDDLDKKSAFYLGFSFETSYSKGEKDNSSVSYGRIIKIENWEPTIGGVFGWSDNWGPHLVFDFYVVFSMGFSHIKYSDQYQPYEEISGFVYPFILKYDIGLLLGYKF
jgi:hypothetical protein